MKKNYNINFLQNLSQSAKTCFTSLFSEKSWKSSIPDNEKSFFLAANKNSTQEIIGFVNFWLIHDEIEIHDFGILQNERQKGVATDLFEHLVDWARQRHATQILLEVRADNSPAIHFYKKMGFIHKGTRQSYYKDGCDAYLFNYSL